MANEADPHAAFNQLAYEFFAALSTPGVDDRAVAWNGSLAALELSRLNPNTPFENYRVAIERLQRINHQT